MDTSFQLFKNEELTMCDWRSDSGGCSNWVWHMNGARSSSEASRKWLYTEDEPSGFSLEIEESDYIGPVARVPTVQLLPWWPIPVACRRTHLLAPIYSLGDLYVKGQKVCSVVSLVFNPLDSNSTSDTTAERVRTKDVDQFFFHVSTNQTLAYQRSTHPVSGRVRKGWGLIISCPCLNCPPAGFRRITKYYIIP